MNRVAMAGALAIGLAAFSLGGKPGTPDQGGATVMGRVRFTGTKPAMRRIDMSEEAQCQAKYKGPPPTEETVLVGANGALANTFVYIKSGLPASFKAAAATTPVVIDQDGCRYKPHVFGLMVGQPLHIKNSDPLLHNIKSKGRANRPFNISQPNVTRAPTVRTFTAPEVMVALECNVHGWMQAYAGVLPHPFFAVTGADGSFTIKNLPAGTYTVEAWHERYGTQTATVTVAGTASATADFSFAGR